MPITPNALYRSNALVLLERLEPKSITLAYIDAPWHIQSLAFSVDPEDRTVAEARYLKFMTSVFQHVHRVLCDDGTLWYHLDRQYSTLFRVVLDEIFGRANYLRDIILPLGNYNTASRISFTQAHDTILVYSKTRDYKLFPQLRITSHDEMKRLYPYQDIYGQYRLDSLIMPSHLQDPSKSFTWHGYTPSPATVWRYSRALLDKFDADNLIDHPTPNALPKLKHYLSDHKSAPIGSLWDDVDLGYDRFKIPVEHRFPTQKPLILLERIIGAATSPGDVVLDPFCGSGTTFIAADTFNRPWIGCDILPEAHQITIDRLQKVAKRGSSADFTSADETTLISTCPPQSFRFPDLSRIWANFAIDFILGAQAPLEEQRSYECKEIKGNNPVNTIKNTVDEYIVAFLNSGEEGHIYWGITNETLTVVGVKLDIKQRDDVRRVILDQINTIQPPVNPGNFQILFWRVHESSHKPVEDLYIVEVVTPTSDGNSIWFTSSDKLFVKTEAGKKQLKGQAMIDFIRERQ